MRIRRNVVLRAAGPALGLGPANYGRFLQMLLNGGTLDGVRILAPHTVALMTSSRINRSTVRARFPMLVYQALTEAR